MNETTSVHFSVQGEFITNLAREKLYQENNFKYAMDLLKSCLQTDQMTDEEITGIAMAILDGRKEIRGKYPSDEYGVYDTPENKLGLCEYLNNINEKTKQLEENYNQLLQKFMFIVNDLSEFSIRCYNNEYYTEYGEPLFESMAPSAGAIKDYQMDQKINMVEDYLKQQKSETEDDYGWLAPDGTYYPVEWGKHAEWAQEYLNEHYPFEDYANIYWKTDSDGKRHHYVNGDCLVYCLHWVLIDNPYQGQGHPTYDKAYGLTKAQKEFLYDYYTERNRWKEANELYEDDE